MVCELKNVRGFLFHLLMNNSIRRTRTQQIMTVFAKRLVVRRTVQVAP